MLEALNFVFFACFWVECLLKLVAFGLRAYFACKWNRFDFLVIVLDTVVLLLELIFDGSSFGVDFTLLRVARISRVFRLVPKMPGLKALFRTLYYSLPSLFNVGLRASNQCSPCQPLDILLHATSCTAH